MTTAKNLTPTLNLKGLGRLAISLIVSLHPVANAQHRDETLKFKPTKDQGGVEIPETHFLGPDLDVKEAFDKKRHAAPYRNAVVAMDEYEDGRHTSRDPPALSEPSGDDAEEEIIECYEWITIKRSVVLREYEKLQDGLDLDPIHYHPDGGNDFVVLHLSGSDLNATSSFTDAQTNAFNLTGHIIAEGPNAFDIVCPACAGGECDSDAVCAVKKEARNAFTALVEMGKAAEDSKEVTGKLRSMQEEQTKLKRRSALSQVGSMLRGNIAEAAHVKDFIRGTSQQDCTVQTDCPDGTYRCNALGKCVSNTCFSLESTVVVKDKGVTSIRDLRIGDMVLSDDRGTYSKFYSKGHYHEEVTTEFLRISTEFTEKPLELTPGHMVFKASGKLPVPAHSLQIEDLVRTNNGLSKVTSIEKIARDGLSNPLTLSGSIVVDDVISSTNPELSGFGGIEAGWIYLAGRRIVHWHSLTHLIHAPHRVICGRLVACVERLDENGNVPFHQFLKKLGRIAVEKESTVFSAGILLVIAAVSLPFWALDQLLEHCWIAFAGICFVVGSWLVIRKKVEANVKAKME